MELPVAVLIHNEVLGIKGTRGDLLNISPQGYYEVNLKFGEKIHRVLLPIALTVIIGHEPQDTHYGGERSYCRIGRVWPNAYYGNGVAAADL